MNGKGPRKKRRSYRPTVEALEALRMLSSVAQVLPEVTVERDLLAGRLAVPPVEPPTGSELAWDEALTQANLADYFGRSATVATPTQTQPQTVVNTLPDARDVASGHAQLNRYLSRAWFRAGIAPQAHDDASQAVYVALLQNLGRTRFDGLLGEIGRYGIRDVLSRETADGPDFFRAIDTVKKRFQRERTFQPIDAVDVASVSPGEDALSLWRGALQEAIDQSLTPREAALIRATLKGETPAEIASQWGVAPKTVSNEKTRVIQKLREAMVADLID